MTNLINPWIGNNYRSEQSPDQQPHRSFTRLPFSEYFHRSSKTIIRVRIGYGDLLLHRSLRSIHRSTGAIVDVSHSDSLRQFLHFNRSNSQHLTKRFTLDHPNLDQREY